MGMSYLTSLNTQLFKNIAYVGSFGHYPVQIAFTCILLSSFFPLITAVSNKGRVQEKSCMASKACSAIGWGGGHGGWPKDKLIY